jgi:hypothetical protein
MYIADRQEGEVGIIICQPLDTLIMRQLNTTAEYTIGTGGGGGGIDKKKKKFCTICVQKKF